MVKSIPENTAQHNLIIAIAEMLADFTKATFKEEMFGDRLGDDHEEDK